jgi:hypothetical protein
MRLLKDLQRNDDGEKLGENFSKMAQKWKIKEKRILISDPECDFERSFHSFHNFL